MKKFSVLFLLIASVFSSAAFALPTFNPQFVFKNQFGETSIMSPQAGTNYAGAFKSATVTLTAAQVIALSATPIQLVAAQSGKLIFVRAVEMLYTKSTAFTVVAAKKLIVQYHTSAVLASSISTTGFIDQSSSKTAMVLGGGAGGVGIGGQAIEITSDDSGMGAGTGSTVKVTVFYDIVNVL